MKTEHILLTEDPHSTWSSGDSPKKNPGGAATPESGASVETRKGNSEITFDSETFFRGLYGLIYGSDYDEDAAAAGYTG